jgi:carbon monoxide dehydrogenase subunit G
MQITGTYRFEHDCETVWNLLMDPQAIATALPGVDVLVPIEDEENAWRADAIIKVATIRGEYSGEVRISEHAPPKCYRIAFNASGQNSHIASSALITLLPDSDRNHTVLYYEADVHISGKLAGIGQRLIKATARLLSKQFFNCLDGELAPPE